MSGTWRFPILFTGPNKAMAVFGATRGTSFVAADGDALVVHLGPLFRARVPLASVVAAAPDRARVLGWGAHGWRGVWLVNGSSRNIVRIDLDPPARARVCGVPVKLTALRVSVEDPAGLQAALTPQP